MKGPRVQGGRTVVMVDSRWFRLIQGRGSTVTALVSVPIPDAGDAELIPAIQQGLRDAGVVIGPVCVAIPSQFTSARALTIPATEPSEIRQIMDLQLETHTPHAKEEVLSDSLVLSSESTGYSRALLTIVHRDVVLRAVGVVEQLRWPIERVGCEFEGIVHWLRHTRGGISGSSSGAVLVVDVDQELSTILVLHDGQPFYHRSVACGVTQLTADPAGGPAMFVAELQRSLEAFEQEGFAVPVAEVVLTGQADQIPSLQASVQPLINLTTMVVPMFERVTLAPAASAAREQGHGLSWTGLLGLALAPGRLDVTPPTVKLRKAFERRAKAMLTVGYRIFAILVLLTVIAAERTWQFQRYRDTLAREQAAIAETADAVSTSLDALHVVSQRLTKRGHILNAIELLSTKIPGDIRLESLTYAAGETVEIRGVSKQLPRVYEFASELGKQPLFSKVEAGRVSKRKIEGQDVTEFEIRCTLAVVSP